MGLLQSASVVFFIEKAKTRIFTLRIFDKGRKKIVLGSRFGMLWLNLTQVPDGWLEFLRRS